MTEPSRDSPTRPRRRPPPAVSTSPAENRSRHYRSLRNPFPPWRVFSDDRVEALASRGTRHSRGTGPQSSLSGRTHALSFGRRHG